MVFPNEATLGLEKLATMNLWWQSFPRCACLENYLGGFKISTFCDTPQSRLRVTKLSFPVNLAFLAPTLNFNNDKVPQPS